MKGVPDCPPRRLGSLILHRALRNAVAAVMPQVTGLVLVLWAGQHHGARAAAAAGIATTAFGVASLLGVGCAISALRTMSVQLRRRASSSSPDGTSTAVSEEMAAAVLFSALGVAVGTVAVLVTRVAAPEVAPPVVAYVIGAVLWIAVSPPTLVSNGVLQAVDRDGINARISVITMLHQVVLLAIVLGTVPSLEAAMFIAGVGNSLVALAAFGYRMVVMARIFDVRVRDLISCPAAAASWSAVVERLAAGIDGVVYMTVFLLASTVAANHSAHAGAVVALGVALMRLAILPIKQIGLVGGRMIVNHQLGSDPRVGLAVVRRAAMSVCALAAAAVIAGGLLSPALPFMFSLLLAAQLLLEPRAGVEFSALKVIVGPAAGARLLMVVYWALAPVALAVCSHLGGADALVVWGILLGARVLFSAGVHRIGAAHLPGARAGGALHLQ